MLVNFLLELDASLFFLSIAIVSLCIGSFLNVVIYRLPIMLKAEWRRDSQLFLNLDLELGEPLKFGLSYPASACPHCKHKIACYENIPLLSFILLRGKCSSCHQPISIRYPLLELVTMLCSLLVAWHFGPTITMLFALLFTWFLIPLTMIDFEHQLLPDRLTYPFIGLGLAINSYGYFVDARQAIWGCLLGFLSLWLVYIVFKLLTHKEGMGYGDFKLLAALGAWLGAWQLPLIILLSSLLGAVVGIVLLKLTKKNQAFAFGPFLAIAGWIALLWGDRIFAFYLGAF